MPEERKKIKMKRIIAGIAAGLMLMGSGVRVYADEAEMVDKDEVIEVLWEENWLGRGDDGIIFPEASYKRHILEQWVSDHYGDDDYNWYDTGNLKYSYADYYNRLTADWDFDDDEDGNWYITTPEHKYSFRIISGKWNMIDENGDTVDTFMPFSTLEEDVTEQKGNVIDDDGDDSPRVIGEPARGTEAVTAAAEDTDSKKGSSALPIAVCGIAVIGGAGAFLYFRNKK